MKKYVKYWLLLGVVLVLVQILLGGVTRLTGSGLSITRWEIIMGTLPPLTHGAWEQAFDLYKETPQYQKINEGMSMASFQSIYFWEYFHRLWARMMGFVFIIPFIYFWMIGHLDKRTLKGLGFVVFFALMAAIFGWIMVASGLVERPLVNAYKLSIHLTLGICVLSALLWVSFQQFHIRKVTLSKRMKYFTLVLFGFIGIQLFLGGMMSGMKAGLYFPTWPKIGTEYFPHEVFNIDNWTVSNFENYDSNTFFPALIHVLHRSVAYVILGLGILFSFLYFRVTSSDIHKVAIILFISLLITQVILGIVTLLHSVGKVPVALGSMHQMIGILLFSTMIFIVYSMTNTSEE